MKKYINKKTQAVIETACVIEGGNWVEVEQPKKSQKPKDDTKVKKSEE